MKLVPATVRTAQAFIKEHHRHLPKVQGGLFAVACADDSGEVLGVVLAANPPRVWQGSGRVVISRVATDGSENACSMLYGAICRAAKALGYREAWTYTLPDEPGTSLRAAGFQYKGLTKAETWDRPSRSRNDVEKIRKHRWMRQLAE